MAGLIESVGEDVYEFRKGDRVAAAHSLMTPIGTYAEYSTAPANTCFLILSNTSFEGTYLNLEKVIAVCGNGIDLVKSLYATTHIIDYRSSNVNLTCRAQKLHLDLADIITP
jgi:hypothetical protein